MNGWTRWIVGIVFLAGTGWAVLQSGAGRIQSLELMGLDREKRLTRVEECILGLKNDMAELKQGQKEIEKLLREHMIKD